MKIHEVKTYPLYFQSGLDGRKPFEVRTNDRDYQFGDVLRQQEWSPHGGFSGRSYDRMISCVFYHPDYVKDGMVILGLSKVPWRIRLKMMWQQWRREMDKHG